MKKLLVLASVVFLTSCACEGEGCETNGTDSTCVTTDSTVTTETSDVTVTVEEAGVDSVVVEETTVTE